MKRLWLLGTSLLIAGSAFGSITNTINKVTYSGNGVTVNFPYSFPLQRASDMQVWVTNAVGVQTLLTNNYQVDTANARVIYPTTGVPLPGDGSIITLLRVVPLTQTVTLSNNGPLPAKTLEQAYDKLTMAQQQIMEQLGRTLQYPVGSVQSSTDTANLLAEIQASSGNATSAAASAVAAAASAASLGTPIPISKGGTNSTTALNNGFFIQSSGGKIVESNVTISSFSVFLPGMSIDYRGAAAPTGWLLEDGTAYSTTTFAGLYAAIGTTYNTENGAADPGAGFFRVPDSRGRVNVGAGSGPGLSARSVGQAFGEETHTLTTSEMPNHSHGINDPGHRHIDTGNFAGGNTGPFGIDGADRAGLGSYAGVAHGNAGFSSSESTGISIQSAGGGAAHNVMQPSLVSLRIIKT